MHPLRPPVLGTLSMPAAQQRPLHVRMRCLTYARYDLVSAAAACMQTYYSGRKNRVINSWVAEGEAWLLEGEGEPAVRLKGTTLDLHLNWLDRLRFADGDAYAWDKARACRTMPPCLHCLCKTIWTFGRQSGICRGCIKAAPSHGNFLCMARLGGSLWATVPCMQESAVASLCQCSI